jgi:hypothetical protein
LILSRFAVRRQAGREIPDRQRHFLLDHRDREPVAVVAKPAIPL